MVDFVAGDGRVVISRDAILRGQLAFQQRALMQHGSFFGDGALRGPDYTADALHQVALAVSEHHAARLGPTRDEDVRQELVGAPHPARPRPQRTRPRAGADRARGEPGARGRSPASARAHALRRELARVHEAGRVRVGPGRAGRPERVLLLGSLGLLGPPPRDRRQLHPRLACRSPRGQRPARGGAALERAGQPRPDPRAGHRAARPRPPRAGDDPAGGAGLRSRRHGRAGRRPRADRAPAGELPVLRDGGGALPAAGARGHPHGARHHRVHADPRCRRRALAPGHGRAELARAAVDPVDLRVLDRRDDLRAPPDLAPPAARPAPPGARAVLAPGDARGRLRRRDAPGAAGPPRRLVADPRSHGLGVRRARQALAVDAVRRARAVGRRRAAGGHAGPATGRPLVPPGMAGERHRRDPADVRRRLRRRARDELRRRRLLALVRDPHVGGGVLRALHHHPRRLLPRRHGARERAGVERIVFIGTVLFLGSGLLGISHNFYWNAKSMATLALGSVFSNVAGRAARAADGGGLAVPPAPARRPATRARGRAAGRASAWRRPSSS